MCACVRARACVRACGARRKGVEGVREGVRVCASPKEGARLGEDYWGLENGVKVRGSVEGGDWGWG